MTQTIELVDLVIDSLRIDYEAQSVTVHYRKVDRDGKTWQTGGAVFWVTIPTPLPGEALSDDWFQLPPEYVPTLLSLRDDADAALTAKFLV